MFYIDSIRSVKSRAVQQSTTIWFLKVIKTHHSIPQLPPFHAISFGLSTPSIQKFILSSSIYLFFDLSSVFFLSSVFQFSGVPIIPFDFYSVPASIFMSSFKCLYYINFSQMFSISIIQSYFVLSRLVVFFLFFFGPKMRWKDIFC